jgi:hypothetical protein
MKNMTTRRKMRLDADSCLQFRGVCDSTDCDSYMDFISCLMVSCPITSSCCKPAREAKRNIALPTTCETHDVPVSARSGSRHMISDGKVGVSVSTPNSGRVSTMDIYCHQFRAALDSLNAWRVVLVNVPCPRDRRWNSQAAVYEPVQCCGSSGKMVLEI